MTNYEIFFNQTFHLPRLILTMDSRPYGENFVINLYHETQEYLIINSHCIAKQDNAVKMYLTKFVMAINFNIKNSGKNKFSKLKH